MSNVCIFPGSFDPIHSGHINVIEQILDSYNFDKVIVLICDNPNKNHMFTKAYRTQLADSICHDLFEEQYSCMLFVDHLVMSTIKDYVDANYTHDNITIARGLRTDFTQEDEAYEKNYKELFKQTNYEFIYIKADCDSQSSTNVRNEIKERILDFV